MNGVDVMCFAETIGICDDVAAHGGIITIDYTSKVCKPRRDEIGMLNPVHHLVIVAGQPSPGLGSPSHSFSRIHYTQTPKHPPPPLTLFTPLS